jgi:hypothetical protein
VHGGDGMRERYAYGAAIPPAEPEDGRSWQDVSEPGPALASLGTRNLSWEDAMAQVRRKYAP